MMENETQYKEYQSLYNKNSVYSVINYDDLKDYLIESGFE